MAIVTRDFAVSAEELVVSMNIVIKERFFPFSAHMTGVALVAAMVVMCVIFEMAGGTGFIHFVFEGAL